MFGQYGSTVTNLHRKPDSTKLASQFAEWTSGETSVGRMLANLKTGFLPDLLATASDGPHAEVVANLFEYWQCWERGTKVPLEVAEGLRDEGLADLLEVLAGGSQE